MIDAVVGSVADAIPLAFNSRYTRIQVLLPSRPVLLKLAAASGIGFSVVPWRRVSASLAHLANISSVHCAPRHAMKHWHCGTRERDSARANIWGTIDALPGTGRCHGITAAGTGLVAA